MTSWKRSIARFGLELGYFTGLARLLTPKTGGIGVILRFAHVRPLDAGQLAPEQAITPQFLDRLLEALREWNFDIISMDEMTQRLADRRQSPERRFVCLTFDGGYRNFLDHSWPLLARHNAPFALYVSSNVPDGLAPPWWLALERVVRDNIRIGLMMDGQERRFSAADLPAKQDLYAMLFGWLRSLPQNLRTEAMADLCGRYRIDAKALCSELCLNWQELNDLSMSPLATLGTATASYAALALSPTDVAERDMHNGRIAMEASLGHGAAHFAYPFGNTGSFDRQHMRMASQLGFTTAVTSEPGVIVPGKTDVMRLPRISWDGQRTSLRQMRVILTGMTVAGRSPKALAN